MPHTFQSNDDTLPLSPNHGFFIMMGIVGEFNGDVAEFLRSEILTACSLMTGVCSDETFADVRLSSSIEIITVTIIYDG